MILNGGPSSPSRLTELVDCAAALSLNITEMELLLPPEPFRVRISFDREDQAVMDGLRAAGWTVE